MTSACRQISVTVSPELLAALDREAFETDETRSACVRRIVTDELRRIGQMAVSSPPTLQLGQNNQRYRAEDRP